MAYPTLMRCLYNSTPVIAGIWTSAIKQGVSTRRGDVHGRVDRYVGEKDHCPKERR